MPAGPGSRSESVGDGRHGAGPANGGAEWGAPHVQPPTAGLRRGYQGTSERSEPRTSHILPKPGVGGDHS